MKRIALAAVFCLPIQMIAQQSVAEIKFHAQTDFFKLPPDLYFGEAAGVAVKSKGHVFVFSRGGTTGPAYGAAAAQLLEFDTGGNYVREIGQHLYAWSFAHAVKIDKEDNVWVADKGSDMVIKFSPEGRILMVFGREQEDLGRGYWSAEACEAATAADRRGVSPGDGYGLGWSREYLHQRRLHQFQDRQDR